MEENIDMCPSNSSVPLATDKLSPTNYHLMRGDEVTWTKAQQPDEQNKTVSVNGNAKTHGENENVEYLVFNKLEDVERYIAEQEIAQTTKFILNRICKGFGTPDPDVASQKKQRVKWIASGVKFMGKPFLLIGDKRYDCRHGKDKNVAKKVRYNERRKCLVNSGEQQRINNVRKGGQLKIDCPAKVQIRDILVYTEFGVQGADQGLHELPSVKDPTNSDSYVKHNAQRRLRDRTSARIRGLLELGTELKTERQFHVSFPKLEAHKGHEVGQAAGTKQRLDRRVIQYIQKLVSEGLIRIDDVKAKTEDYVAQLFIGKQMPEKDNRRYYPLAKDISNHVQKSMASIMSCRGSAHNLQQLYEKLRKENSADCVFFRPSVEGSSRLLYLHQTSSQQRLLKENASSRCILEVKYRDKKTSLPMFLVYVDIQYGRQTVATFILEVESDLAETIAKLKENNPCWSPSDWVIEGSDEHVSTLQTLFPGCSVVCKESQEKTNRCGRKRCAQAVLPSAKPPADTLRQLLREFEEVSHNLPSSSDTWAIVNSLGAVLQQAKDLAASTSSVLVSDKISSKVGRKTSTPSRVWESNALTSTANSMEHLTSSEPVHLSDHHGNYVNINQQSLVQPHYPQHSLGSQQTTSHLPTPSTSHSLLGVTHSPGLSLHVSGMLGDGYNLHHGSNVYTPLPTQQQPRHYVDLQNQQQQDTQTFAQHLVKVTE